MAWLEIMKIDDDIKDKEVVTELEKDISKLELITSRFSSIGSIPVLREENISKIIEQTVNYLKKRTSKKVNLYFECKDDLITADINKPLFDWVIENLCKNLCIYLNLKGPVCIQLKEDSKGRFKFIEVNPRLGGGTYFSTLAGANFLELMLKIKNKQQFKIPNNMFL